MDVSGIPLLKLLSQRATWLGKRQELLSQNVANADTPGYRARDLTDSQFQSMVKRHVEGTRNTGSASAMVATRAGHFGAGGNAISGTGGSGGNAGGPDFRARLDKIANKNPGPDGNSVNLEDELIKVSETAGQYQMVTRLYKKQLDMIRTAIGRGS